MKVREGGRVVKVAVIATGVNADGYREILGMHVATTESGAGWLSFLRDLVARGLTSHGPVALMTSDAHTVLVDAVGATLPGAAWPHRPPGASTANRPLKDRGPSTRGRLRGSAGVGSGSRWRSCIVATVAAIRAERSMNPHLQNLEDRSIHILREAVAESRRPALLYSVGKDSSVLLHLSQRAFYPAPLPFPLLHVDTTWKFQEMYAFRDQVVASAGADLIVHRNPDAVAAGINPFEHGSAVHTQIWKTEGLRQAIDEHRFDVTLGGARRDEEASRSKERVFSWRSAQHQWEPKRQRPELWRLYNTMTNPGEHLRVFPLSDWTELDVWRYIEDQRIPVVSLYLARPRPVVERDGLLIVVDDDRMPMRNGERPTLRHVRFRTLGCYPLTGATESDADSVSAVVQELVDATGSERQGRSIDHDSSGSMEKKKREGYF